MEKKSVKFRYKKLQYIRSEEMPVIQTLNPTIKSMTGLHLYHASISNCSQKVRLCLDEKSLVWESHEVNLRASEHLAPEFLSINPRGVVPVLVDDGIVVNESNDIIQYIEEKFPDPPLSPTSSADALKMRTWLELWDETQPAIKTLTHAGKIGELRRAAGRLPLEVKMAEENGLDNDHLYDFLKELSSPAGLSSARKDEALAWAAHVSARLEHHLADHAWLSGPDMTLADLAWSIDVHRFLFLNIDMSAYSSILRWYSAISNRPSFKKMVVDYEQMALKLMAITAE
jgi:glutathione S-transferase